jgi:hypothetical protein
MNLTPDHHHDHAADGPSHHGHQHHGHAHGPSSPHPPSALPLSLLRLSLVNRFTIAAGASAVLWAAVFFAMR